ncbi:MAG: DNA-protecting protein DprA [Flavobacteriaceae bacterium]|nr:DNA-protecting protein DprA [Flavobacteriaceae bacterium]
MNESQLLQTLALQKVSKIGDITAKKLIHHCGSVEGIFKEKKESLLKIDGFGKSILEDLFNTGNLKRAEDELRFIKNNGIQWHYFMDDSYPDRLKHCIDGPILLFQKGQINIQQQPIISIVGTRSISSHGIDFCENLIEHLAPFNPIIVSGFAYGTDITAQKAALKHNLQTIGCLAHGFDQIYPKIHKKYVKSVERYGGFFTDFWSTDNFDRNNFLKRNRIIAGLSEATIIIESAEKGGSLVTADIALSYNREVFAVPGRPSDAQSIGCNNLIKLHRAHVLSQAEDIPYILNWKNKMESASQQKKIFIDLDKDEQLVLDFLKDNGKSLLDIIALKTDMPTYRIATLLLNLELKDLVRPLPGKLFESI